MNGEALHEERRGRTIVADRTMKSKSSKKNKTATEELIEENQRLRMEIDYLKKLDALVLESQLRDRKRK